MERKKGVVLSYILMVFEVLSTLLITPLIIQSLGQAEYGVYRLTASIAAYLLLLDLGIGNSIIRYTAKYRANGEIEQLQRFFGVSQIYYLVMAIIAGICGAGLIMVFPKLFATGLSSEEIALGQILLGITTVNVAVTLVTAVFNNIIIGYGLFSVSRGASIIQIVIRIIVTYIALMLGMKSIALVSIQLIMTILLRGGFGVYVFVKLKLLPKLKGVTWEFIFEIVAYSSWILLQMIATQINGCADQVLLGIFVPGSAIIIGVYGVGSQLVSYFQSIGSSVSGVLFPGVVNQVEADATPEQLQDEMIRIGRINLIILSAVLIGFLNYGNNFIELWAGPENVDAFYVALLLMIAHLFIQVESIGTQILWAKNAHKEQSILKIAIVLMNIILTIILIKWNPLIGATLGTFVSLILGDVLVMNIVFKMKIGISLIKYYYGLFKGLLLASVLSWIITFFIRVPFVGWLGLILNIIIFMICYTIATYYIGMNLYEKELISSILDKLLHKVRRYK